MTTRAFIAATIGGATFASVSVLAHAGPLALARLAVLGAALASAAFFDLTQRRVPNRIVLPAAATCAALTLAAGAPFSLLAGIATILVLLIVSQRWPAALGMGDVKLALLLVLAGLAGLALLIRQGRTAWRKSLPMAPFLVVSALLTVIA
jgi:prepilin signal peptidase PulO-like enzyme (type II secretory pathway)